MNRNTWRVFVLEKNVQERLDQCVRNDEVLYKVKAATNILHTRKRRTANDLLKRITERKKERKKERQTERKKERKKEEGIEVTGKQAKTPKQLLNDLKEKKRIS
jgi:hypothetical protein